MNVVFVVLHYENLKDTRECLNSLVKYTFLNEVDIIVVDNGSKKQKLEIICEEYKENTKFHFVILEKNLGFAKGNNIGFKLAKEQYNADIIVLANNDLVFGQQDFVDKIIDHYNNDKFDVAGPRIISLVDGKNQNPVPVQYKSIHEVDKRIIKYYILYLLSIINIDGIIQSMFAKEIQEFYPREDEDYQLHGACMLFAGRYIKAYDGLYDKTFMYNEENILKEIVTRKGMKMRYFSDIEVKHKEGSATCIVYGKGRRKRQFYYKWSINSCKILRKLKMFGEDFDD